MIVTAEPVQAREWTLHQSGAGRVAFVPTMGALHDGHLTLVRRARQLADHVAVSIFVNPTQFAPSEDLNKYPRPIDADLAALRHEGVSMVFTPSNEAVYPPGFSTYVQPPRVAEELEGRIRPGHFRGVCTVVLKLFQIIPASVAVFGQKDFQQALVITNMVNDLCVPITIDVVPTVREPDGLAMSSRNRYLSSEERARALCLSKALREAKRLFDQGERWAAALQAAMMAELKPGQPDGVDTLDYAVIADRRHLGPFARVPESAVALVAARIGTTRLIDNQLLIPSTP